MMVVLLIPAYQLRGAWNVHRFLLIFANSSVSTRVWFICAVVLTNCSMTYNTVFTRRFGVYFQIQSETGTIDFPVEFDMAAVQGGMHPSGEAVASMKAVTYTINLTHHLIATA